MGMSPENPKALLEELVFNKLDFYTLANFITKIQKVRRI